MEIPTHYLFIMAEVFFTTLGLLIVLIYLYIKSDRKWQLLVHRLQDELLDFRNQYREEKARGDVVRDLLHNKISALKKAEEAAEGYLAEIARLKEEITKLHQSEKLRSEIANQLITSKAETERLTVVLCEHEKTADQLQQTIHTLEDKIATLTHSPQAEATPPETNLNDQNSDLQTNGSMEFERLKARADKQLETIRELELELMKLGYKNPSKLIEKSPTEAPSSNQNLEQMLNESETCVQLLENELSELQNKVNILEEQAGEPTIRQESSDTQRLEQMLKESETCNTLLENELDSLMQKVRLLEGKETPPKEAVYYDI
ncbi:MAG: hypothetical protein L3J26_04470 [Candidatus Polarisedimenticolaceae bacterium]|nr:hypothetical protein [Candidatus Polarisedimenticolaceae bacterium]